MSNTTLVPKVRIRSWIQLIGSHPYPQVNSPCDHPPANPASRVFSPYLICSFYHSLKDLSTVRLSVTAVHPDSHQGMNGALKVGTGGTWGSGRGWTLCRRGGWCRHLCCGCGEFYATYSLSWPADLGGKGTRTNIRPREQDLLPCWCTQIVGGLSLSGDAVSNRSFRQGRADSKGVNSYPLDISRPMLTV